MFKNCFQNKNILITGASRGLGRALTQRLTSLNANVFALSMNVDRLKKLKLDFPQISTISVDLSNWEATRLEIDKIELPFYAIINNAGFGESQNVMQTKYSDFKRTFNTNVGAVINIAQSAVPKMIRDGAGGSIVNISSITSIRGTPTGAAYSLSKSSLNMLTQIMAVELGKHKIRVNTLCPAGFESDMMIHAMNSYYGSNNGLELRNKQMTKRTPLKNPLMDIEEIVNATLFLLSDSVPNLTGSCLVVDGGFLCT